MVNLDISKVLPERPHDYLGPFFPGMFFEVSILIANPELVSRLAARAKQIDMIGHFSMLAIAIFLAFAIGNGFMLLTNFIQYVLQYLYRFLRLIWMQLCRWPIKQFLDWLLKKPRWARPGVVNFYRGVLESGFGRTGSQEMKDIMGCWQVLATRLLKVGYGIETSDIRGNQWDVFYWILGKTIPEDGRGSLFMMATHATGWSGLAAIRFAPALHNKSYIFFCLFLILNGLLHDHYVTMRRIDPRARGYINIRAILREFRELRKDEAKVKKPTLDSAAGIE